MNKKKLTLIIIVAVVAIAIIAIAALKNNGILSGAVI